MARKKMEYPPHWTPVEKGAYHLLRVYQADGKRGAEAMGPRIGKSAKLLNNETAPDYEGAKLGLRTAVMMELESGRADILHGHAAMLRHVCFPLPGADLIIGDVELLCAFSDWQAKMGITCNHIRDALDPDGPHGTKITKEEAAHIEAAGMEHIAKFMEFLTRIRELSE